jgi:enoyl-CoA hydratase/carnithine racemase
MLMVERNGPVLRLTLSRPEVKNALDEELIGGLLEAFASIRDDVRVVVLSGVGDTFCAGGDLNWMRRAASYTEEQNFQDAFRLSELFASISTCHALVVAKVNGSVFGGGGGLVAASDYAIAVPGARFSFSEVRLGLVPATISPFVIQKVGPGHARALFATGKVFDAGHALCIGLVHELADPEILEARVVAVIRLVLSAGPNAVAAAKRLATEPSLSGSDAARLLSRIRATDEAKEGLAAFLEKRKAAFVSEP